MPFEWALVSEKIAHVPTTTLYQFMSHSISQLCLLRVGSLICVFYVWIGCGPWKLACMVCRKAQDGIDNIFQGLMSHQIKRLDKLPINSLIL